MFLADVGDVVREQQDGAVATAGTIVAGVQGTQTATTGDVRGSYAPNSNPNGILTFDLIAFLRAPAYTGAAQFSA